MKIQNLILLPLLAVSACTIPDLGTRPAGQDAAALGSARALSPTTGAWPTDDWWRGFGDAQLDRLIATAIAGSPDVVAAAARGRASDALVRQSGGVLAPSLTLDGVVGGNKQSENLGIPRQFVPNGVRDTGRLTASFAFDLDLWGRNRAALRAARGEAAAARVDGEQARLMLTTDIASAYADLARLYEARDVAVAALDVRSTTARITRLRFGQGLETRGASSQAEARVPSARADLGAIDESIAITRHRLAALAGKGPDFGDTLARPRLAPPAVGIPVGAGIDLVGRRPDLVAARLRAEAAGERIKVARADFYPNLSLGAIVGLQSLGLGRLFEGSSSYGNGGPAFSLPVFDGGRIAGRYRGARADYDVAVADYDRTLLLSLREAADAATSLQATETQLADQRASLAANEDAAKVARLRYTGGLSNQLPVLIADDALLASRRTVSELAARRVTLSVALVRALGGGYRETSLASGAR